MGSAYSGIGATNSNTSKINYNNNNNNNNVTEANQILNGNFM